VGFGTEKEVEIFEEQVLGGRIESSMADWEFVSSIATFME
jgi:hypothetical protein